MEHPFMPNICDPPNAVWVWMTLLGVYTPLASGTLRLFLADNVTFSYVEATARGVDAVLSLREESLEPIRERTLWWYVVGESVGDKLRVRASFLPKGRRRNREWIDATFTLDGEGRLAHVQQTKSYVVGEEVSDIA
jgi:hypothetical protein